MDLVMGAMNSLIPKLLQLLGDEYKLQTGMKKKVQFLARELDSIRPFLRKVSDVPWDQLDKQVKVWACEAREASYDMEDILDTFLVRVEGCEPNDDPSRMRHTMKKITNVVSTGSARHDVGSAIEDIMNKLQELADRRARYRIDDIMVNPAATTSTVDPRLQAMYKEAADLVGINKPRDDLISKLSAHRKRIVAIVGVGGLGKTTLAKAVYDKLRADFKCRAFVPVGRNPNLAKLLMDILYELNKKKFEQIHKEKIDIRQLINKLRKFLKHKRYFIVIDDIWETKSWIETIRFALPENDCGNRIIITTRNSQVAKEIGDEVYRMQPLSDDNSKNLFYKGIFGAKEKCPDKPDEISQKFLTKCGGVPLAIITMASLLVGKPREKWSDVFNSVGFGHQDDKEVDNAMKILSFSYYDMPAPLRTCLLYLSVYPEEEIIDRECLIWKWIAEGFIQEKPGIRLFELGEQYFNDLVNRSMIQVVNEVNRSMILVVNESRYDEKKLDCRVHDMVLDLIRSISFKENFVTILDNDKHTLSPPPSCTRRLSLHGINMEQTADDCVAGMPKVRSLTAIGCTFGNRVPFSSYKLLRVLDMRYCKYLTPSHLVYLEHLHHLRYLGLAKTRIYELPNEIGALRLLQTLNLDNTRIKRLPPSISRLTRLVCLKGSSGVTLAPNWIGKLTSLEELQHLNNYNEEDRSRGFLKELGNLRELRVFQCRVYQIDESMQRDLVLSLRNLHKLQHLDLRCHFRKEDTDTTVWGEAGFVLPRHLRILHLRNINFSCLPPCIGAACLPNLTHLSLHVDAMDQKGLEFLGRLPELYYLCLDTKSTVIISNNINASNSYFQKLRFCLMDNSMIQFRGKEGDSSVSFHIWNGINAMPFSSNKNDCNLAPYAVMPNLEVLKSMIFLRALKDGKGDCGNIGLEYLPSLQRVQVSIRCNGASGAEVEEAEVALRDAISIHPNLPMLISRNFYSHLHREERDMVKMAQPQSDTLSKYYGDIATGFVLSAI